MGENNESEVWDPVLITESWGAQRISEVATWDGSSWENHRKTIGKWWFNGDLMGFYGILWDVPSGNDSYSEVENGYRNSGIFPLKW